MARELLPIGHEVELSDEEEITRSMARRRKNTGLDALHTCRDCLKEFKRPCDLTKHEKTHSRPWKCHFTTCKYYDLGWPTEKERDRHVNDKHMSTVPQYKCRFSPCTYSSKRESNCKQHMEKAHGWEYVRSKSNGKRGNTTTDEPAALGSLTPRASFVADGSCFTYSFGANDIETFDYAAPSLTYAPTLSSSSNVGGEGTSTDDSVLIDASEPLIPLSKNSTGLFGHEKLKEVDTKDSNAFASPKHFAPPLQPSNDLYVRPAFLDDQNPAASANDFTLHDDWHGSSFSESLMLFDADADFDFNPGDILSAPLYPDEPVFSPPTLSDLTGLDEGFSEPPTDRPRDTDSTTTIPEDVQPQHTDVAIDCDEAVGHSNSADVATTTKTTEPKYDNPRPPAVPPENSPDYENTPNDPRDSQSTSPSTDANPQEAHHTPAEHSPSLLPACTKRPRNGHVSTPTCPSPKKQKKTCKRRRLLSCPFRKHNPHTYNFTNSKYKTCHTTAHEYISTLLRHLERYHSAIICHCCLTTFASPDESGRHKKAADCAAARGSQEDKWQALYKRFCDDGVRHDPGFESACAPAPAPATQSELHIATSTTTTTTAPTPTSESGFHETNSPSQAPLQLHTPPRTPIVSPQQQRAESVPLDDAERRELARLRDENNVLLRENNVLLRKLLQWESVCGTDLSKG